MTVNLKQAIKSKFPRRTIKAQYPHEIWSADLMDMTNRREEGPQLFILCVVDVFSRYAWAYKLNSKSKNEIQKGLQSIFNNADVKPKKIWSDLESGVQALKNWFELMNIELYHVNNSYNGPNTHSVSIVERFNRTLRDAINTTQQETGYNYATAIKYTLHNFLPYYNSRIHKTLKMSPKDALEVRQDDVIENQEQRANKPRGNKKILQIGTKIYLQKVTFLH